MTRKRRTFTSEFKAEAAVLILDKGYSYTETCRTLNVGESALRRWVPNSKLSVVEKRLRKQKQSRPSNNVFKRFKNASKNWSWIKKF